MATKMIDLGVKEKEMYPAPEATAKPGSEKRYPELSLSGPHAEMMGAEDLKEGDVVEQTVRWRVKRHSKTTANGKTEYAMTLCLEKAGDCKDCGSESGDDTSADEGDGEDDSPAMSYIKGRAKNAE